MDIVDEQSDKEVHYPHIESKACQKAMDDSKILKAIRKKLKNVARKSNKSPKFKRALKKEQKGWDIPVITLSRKWSPATPFSQNLSSASDEFLSAGEEGSDDAVCTTNTTKHHIQTV